MSINEIRITRVPSETSANIKDIAKKRGQTVCEFVRPQIRGIVEAFPVELQQPREQSKVSEIRLSGISPELEQRLTNIADNLGISPTQLLRIKMHEIANGRSF